jgi:hypothetical protein
VLLNPNFGKPKNVSGNVTMTLYRTYTTIIGLLFWLTSFSQTEELRNIDNALTNSFQTMVSADPQLRYDSLAPEFLKFLSRQLANPTTFNNSFDSLSKYLTIKISADKQIKFYSWDDIGGGTWHNINCIAQFKSDKGKIIVQQLNTESALDSVDFTDSRIYEVYEIFINGTKYYLTFASGTHGSGHQHKIVQIFSITSDKLVKCKSCFADNNDFIIEYPRSDKANLVFNEKTNEISYSEFKLDDNIGFYRPTGHLVTLKLINGKFTTR